MFNPRVILLLVAALLALSLPAAAAAERTITVTGHAEELVVPDIAVVTAGIVTTGPDVESARGENDRTMRQIIDALVAQGIDRSKIATSQFFLQPIYRSDAKDGGRGTISGYRLQNSVTVVVDNLAGTGAVIDAVFQAGANQFQSLRFGLKNAARLQDELLAKAVQDGQRKAAVIAEALGVKLGPPVSVTESSQAAQMQADVRFNLKAAAGAPVEAGSLTASRDVNMAFSIIP